MSLPAPATFRLVLIVFAALAATAHAEIRRYDFVIAQTQHTRLCSTNTLLTVNGMYPGPTIYARKGDTVFVNVRNQGNKNVTIHWHGVHQPRYPWSDGPVYVTQCPIQPGSSFIQKIIFSVEEGTLWYHAHTDYDRWSVYGAIVVQPKAGTDYPFPKPHKEAIILLGEWFSGNITAIVEQQLQTGGGIPLADALTINGQPGDLNNCSKTGTFKIPVRYGQRCLLRVINAGMDNLFFVGLAGHRLTVVGTDSSYVKPLPADYIMISGGQTMDVLFTADRFPSFFGNNRYYLTAMPFQDSTFNYFNKTPATAIVEYTWWPSAGLQSESSAAQYRTDERIIMSTSSTSDGGPEMPKFPKDTNATAAQAYYSSLRSLASAAYPVNVPKTIDQRIIMTVNMGVIPCPGGPCPGTAASVNFTKLSASVNNVSYASPAISILHAYKNGIPGVYTTDFPLRPPMEFDYTAPVEQQPMEWLVPTVGTKVVELNYGTNVEIVLQGTSLLGAQTHPMHLHGYNFYVVGYGLGNFNEKTDPAKYNLVDPPYHNTVSVPGSGWTAIRFRATNPGVWFMHCHFERHIEWGMGTVFIVKDGAAKDARMEPPPPDMPPC